MNCALCKWAMLISYGGFLTGYTQNAVMIIKHKVISYREHITNITTFCLNTQLTGEAVYISFVALVPRTNKQKIPVFLAVFGFCCHWSMYCTYLDNAMHCWLNEWMNDWLRDFIHTCQCQCQHAIPVLIVWWQSKFWENKKITEWICTERGSCDLCIEIWKYEI